MKKRISVDPKDVKPGDVVKIDGYGWLNGNCEVLRESKGYALWEVTGLVEGGKDFIAVPMQEVPSNAHIFRLSSILSAEREVDEEPKVEVGTWSCLVNGTWNDCKRSPELCAGLHRRVMRSTGWSPDTRKNTGPIKLAVGMIAKATGWANPHDDINVDPRLLIDERVEVRRQSDDRCWIVYSFTHDQLYELHQRNLDAVERRK